MSWKTVLRFLIWGDGKRKATNSLWCVPPLPDFLEDACKEHAGGLGVLQRVHCFLCLLNDFPLDVCRIVQWVYLQRDDAHTELQQAIVEELLLPCLREKFKIASSCAFCEWQAVSVRLVVQGARSTSEENTHV